MTTFRVPDEYKDFVSSKDQLLNEIRLNPNYYDDCAVFFIWLDGKYFDTEEAFQASVQSIQDKFYVLTKPILQGKQREYLWHSMFEITLHLCQFELSSTKHCLSGVIKYGDNIEDEWFLVYILFQISQQFPHVCIQVQDNDGEFLLIEAADALPSWLTPENADHRLWICQGNLYIIPWEVKPLITNEFAIDYLYENIILPAALGTITTNTSTSYLIDSHIERIIYKRIQVFPQRLLALDHHITCILPLWMILALDYSPNLIASAIYAFSITETNQVSKIIQSIHFPEVKTINSSIHQSSSSSESANSRTSNHDLLWSWQAKTVRLTKALYAQLTYKQFKIPRKYHSIMRRMALSHSAKVQKAFELGCRLLCGFELAIALERNSHCEEQQQSMPSKDTVKNHQKVLQLNGDLMNYNKDNSNHSHEKFETLITSLLSVSPTIEQYMGKLDFTQFIQQQQQCQPIVSDEVLFQQIRAVEITSPDSISKNVYKNTLIWDNDDWLYMPPEQFEAYLESISIARHSESSGSTTTAASGNNNHPTINPTIPSPSTMPPPPPSSAIDENQSLNEILSQFKSFLSSTSDYDGANNQSSKKAKSQTTSTSHSPPSTEPNSNLPTTSTPVNSTSEPSSIDFSTLDYGKIDQLLQQLSLNNQQQPQQKEKSNSQSTSTKLQEEKPHQSPTAKNEEDDSDDDDTDDQYHNSWDDSDDDEEEEVIGHDHRAKSKYEAARKDDENEVDWEVNNLSHY
jgi:hypothetical protein